MDKKVIKLYDVIGDTPLPEISVKGMPQDGDPLEIKGEIYFVCERNLDKPSGPEIGVIPLVVRNPSGVTNIRQYVDCLSMAHRKVLFRNKQGYSDLENSDEMIISLEE